MTRSGFRSLKKRYNSVFLHLELFRCGVADNFAHLHALPPEPDWVHSLHLQLAACSQRQQLTATGSYWYFADTLMVSGMCDSSRMVELVELLLVRNFHAMEIRQKLRLSGSMDCLGLRPSDSAYIYIYTYVPYIYFTLYERAGVHPRCKTFQDMILGGFNLAVL